MVFMIFNDTIFYVDFKFSVQITSGHPPNLLQRRKNDHETIELLQHIFLPLKGVRGMNALK